ncbi:hypothetical protein CHARACLAT_015808, partial [Characodon lateralis]|nr:hypothetical protein [Characodon lateralis]
QETVDFPSFVRVLAHFRPKEKNQTREGAQQEPEPANSRNQKLKFAFQLYDRDRDGKISRVELLQVWDSRFISFCRCSEHLTVPSVCGPYYKTGVQTKCSFRSRVLPIKT